MKLCTSIYNFDQNNGQSREGKSKGKSINRVGPGTWRENQGKTNKPGGTRSMRRKSKMSSGQLATMNYEHSIAHNFYHAKGIATRIIKN